MTSETAELEALRQRVAALEAERDALRESEKRSRLLLSSIPQRVFFKDTDSRFVGVNRQMAEGIGQPAEQIIGRSDYDFFPRRLAEKYRYDDRRVMEMRQPETLVEQHVQEGRRRWVEVTKAPVIDDDGTVLGLMGLFNDVTERHEAEIALAEQQRILRSILDSIADGVVVIDERGHLVLVNPSAERMLGPRARIASIDEHSADFVLFHADGKTPYPPEHLPLAQALRGESVDDEELFVRHERAPRGVWLSVSTRPLVDDHGKLRGAVAAMHDITERKRAESALRVSGQRYRDLVENANDIVFTLDLHGRITSFNQAGERLTGYTRAEAVGRPFVDLVIPTDRERVRRVLELRFEGSGPATFQFGIGAKLQKTIWVDVGTHVLHQEGRVVGLQGIARDVTDRREADARLRESEARKSAILESALDCIITMDHGGRITEFNPSAERTFGYKRGEVLGKHFEETITQFLTDTGARLEQNFARASGGSMVGNRIECVARRADGTTFPAEMAMTVVNIGTSGVFTIYLRDITERKRAAEELRRRNEALSKAYEELKEAEAALIHSEKMAAIGQLVAGLAHEINNPTAFVLTNLDNIERDLMDLLEYIDSCRALEKSACNLLPDETKRLVELREQLEIPLASEEIRMLLQSCQAGMRRISDLVVNLRSYSHIDVKSEYGMSDLNEGLEATLVLLQPIIGKHATIVRQFGTLPLVECNLGQLNQVFMNLIVNAAQALEGQGTVTITSEVGGNGVIVKVADTGRGIPAEVQSRIFDPFFTTKDVGEGTGLGLSIARKIVDAHHGSLTFESTVGKGTTFRLWVPSRQPRATQDSDLRRPLPSPTPAATPSEDGDDESIH